MGWDPSAISSDLAMSDLISTHCPMANLDDLEAARRCGPDSFGALRGLIPLRHPHIVVMAHWQASITRAPPKTKAELRQMLTEAVRNTQAGAANGAKQPPKAKNDRG